MVWYKSNVVDVGTLAQNILSTASGSIVHITDGADNIPVKSLVSQIVAVETGSGEKSPENPYTISGFDSGVVPVCGVNIFDEEMELGSLNVNTGANNPSSVDIRSKNYINVKPNTTYFFYATPAVANVSNYGLVFYDINKTYISGGINKAKMPFTTPNNAFFIRFFVPSSWYGSTTYNNDISINYPSSDTQYHAYNGNTYEFAFGQTVYGGHFDNKGNLVVTYAQTDINSAISNRTTSYVNPVFYGSISGLKPQSNNSLCEAFNTINGQLSAQLFAQNSNNHDFSINSLNSGDTVQVFVRADEYTDVASLKSACGNSKIKYELANPITLSITSQDIPTLLGENNIFSNCGDVEVNYYNANANVIADLVRSL